MPWNGWWHRGWMWLFCVIVIIAIVLLARGFTLGTRGASETRETPEEILKRRYTKGEIDKEEIEQKLEDRRR